MIFAPGLLILPAILILAASPAGAGQMKCMVPKAPSIDVKVATNPIEYDFSKTSAMLTAMESSTVSPYAPDMDTVSGGLREDHPTVKSQINWKLQYDERRNIACMWYDTITIQIVLDPKIYVAREFNKGACREAVLGHERRHVDVDHIVINKFARNMGEAVRVAVNSAGAMGPFNYSEVDKMQALSSRHIESAVDSQQLLMQKEMQVLQGRVDSLEEYKRISAQCRHIKIEK